MKSSRWYVTEIPTSARAGLVWPCGKGFWADGSGQWRIEPPESWPISADGWVFPPQRSMCTDWYWGLRVDTKRVLRASTYRQFDREERCEAWAVGVVAFGEYNVFARALFIPYVGLAAKTSRILRRLFNGHGGRRELFGLNPKLRYALTGKR